MTSDINIKTQLPTNPDEAFELLENGDMVVDLEQQNPALGSLAELNYTEGHYENLVPLIDQMDLDEIGQKILSDVDDDERSREDWINTLTMGLDLMGIKLEEKNKPFKGACSAQHPLLMEAAVKFQSKASSELLPANGPVEVKTIGAESAEREDQALRVKSHMNWQVTEQMTEYYTDTEKLLLYTSLIGSGFKKTYYDGKLDRPVSEFVPADQFIVPNNASDLQRASRYTHKLYKTKHQINELFASGFYEKPDVLGDPAKPQMNSLEEKTNQIEGIVVDLGDEDKVYTLYEMHCYLYIEGLDERDDSNGHELASPYIVTVDADKGSVLSIRRNWLEKDETRTKLMNFTHYGFVPGFGFYNYGFIHLLGNLQLSLTSSLRSLVDAGQFANLQGGFKLKGVRIVDDGDPIAPGEFKDIEAAVQDINKAIMRLPFGEPSTVLYNMLEFLDRKGQKFADSTEQVIADSTNYGPVGTTLALLDASTKFFSAVHKRLHNAQKHELKIIGHINSKTLKKDSLYNVSNPERAVTRKDYDARIDIVPISDPNISSNAHRIAKAQAVYQLAQSDPDAGFDKREVARHVLLNMDYDNVDKLLPPPEQATEQDPLTDIQLATQGKPIKAFPGQQHDSHIQIKQAFLNDPFSGGNKALASARAILEANIQEHMMLKFQEGVQAAQQQGMTPEQAAQKIAQMNLEKQERMAQQDKDGQDEAAMLMAQAEYVSSQTEKRKQEFDELAKTAELELGKEKLDLEKMKLKGKMIEVDTKLAGDIQKIITTKSLDAMIEDMKMEAEENRDDEVHERDKKAESKDDDKDDNKE